MRISDWSSYVCSSELSHRAAQKERHRPGFEDVVWFRMDIGRRQNADPRWILPLLCRRGHITRNEIGAIRIGSAETFIQIPRALADRFAVAVERTAQTETDGENGNAAGGGRVGTTVEVPGG